MASTLFAEISCKVTQGDAGGIDPDQSETGLGMSLTEEMQLAKSWSGRDYVRQFWRNPDLLYASQ
jgi:hypothetical protein